MTTNHNLLQAVEISKSFKRESNQLQILKKISFSVDAGQFVALWGPSGSGKSSLLNILGAVETPDSGQVWVASKQLDFNNQNKMRLHRLHKLGYLFQHFHLLTHLTALENAMLPLLANNNDWNKSKKMALELFERLGIQKLTNAFPQQLSGGEMQRVALIRATIHKPIIILADEPTGSLDSVAGAEVIRLLTECANQGTAVIMATHNQNAIAACSKVIALKDGQLDQELSSIKTC